GRRVRIPDVSVLLKDPGSDVVEVPPYICVEVLSRRDEKRDLMDKLKEYSAFGVPNIWVVDPRRRKAFVFDGSVLEEVRGEAFVITNPEIRLPLDEVFLGL